MAPKNDALRKRWSKLNDLKKLTLQILAALSDKGAETEAVAVIAQALTGDPTVENRFARNLRDLDKKDVWFAKSGAKSRRKLAAPARKAVVEWRDETPGWPLRFQEQLFDALSLMARDDIQAAAFGMTDGRDMRRQKYARHIADLYPDLLELRAVEAAAVLAMYYGFSENEKEYARWRDAFAEWVEFTPLPQTPMLFLGATRELQPFAAGRDIFGFGGHTPPEALLPETEVEDWDLARADALAEYLQDVAPGDQASAYCALTLRALAALPAWHSEREPQVARERLGAYGTALLQLRGPVIAEPPFQTLARRRSMLQDLFCPLAAKVEDYFGEFGPARHYLFEMNALLDVCTVLLRESSQLTDDEMPCRTA